MRKKKKVSDKEVFDFWSEHDATEHLDMSKAIKVTLPNLKRSTKSITMRLPAHLLDDLKRIANKYDVPYQSYIKILLAKAINHEDHRPA